MRFMHQESAFSGLFSLTLMRKLTILEEMRAEAAINERQLRAAHIQDRRYLRQAGRKVDLLQSGEDRAIATRELADAVDSNLRGSSKAPTSCRAHHSLSDIRKLR